MRDAAQSASLTQDLFGCEKMFQMRTAINKKFGSLKSFVLEGAPGGPAVILFHGYGADAGDLLPLAEMMGLDKSITWVFPDAPMEVIIAPGFTGRAWFQIDNKRLEAALQNGEPADLSQTTPSRKSATWGSLSLQNGLRDQGVSRCENSNDPW